MIPKFTATFLLLLPTMLLASTPSSILLNVSAPETQYGKPLTLTAVVSPSSATGQVTFYRGVTILETVPFAGGKATFTTSLLPFGSHSLTAYYLGNATYAPSLSAAVIETVKTVPSRGFSAPSFNGPEEDYFTIAVGDFNGDGIPDVALGGAIEGGVMVFLGTGAGKFQAPAYYTALFDNFSLVVGDFNGDGIPDLASSDAYYLVVLFGNGDGTFQPAVDLPPLSFSESLVVGDFNGDGKADIAFAEGDSSPELNPSGLGVILGNGDGTFQSPSNFASSIGYGNALIAADFNGDGKTDLAVAVGAYDDVGGTFVSVLLGNGDGSFQSPVNTTLASIPYNLAAYDLNGDGHPDLAVTTQDGIAVLLGSGDGSFVPAVYYQDGSATYTWSPIAVSDINGDGKADLVALVGLNSSAAAVEFLFGNGDGTFQPPLNNAAANGTSYLLLALADFNGDGRVDLAESQNSGSELSVQLGSTVGPTTTALTSSPNPSAYTENVTLTASVTPNTSEGTVTFYNGSTDLGTGKLANGGATLVLSSLPTGELNLTAVYGGDSVELTSTSNVLVQQVNSAPTSTTLLSSPNPSTLGQEVTLVAEIAPGAATGHVTFYHGSTVLGSAAVSKGRAVLSTTTLLEGPHALSATYFGSSDYAPSTSPTITQVVK